MTRYPIVFETEDHGVISAYVVGLPIYAQAATQAAAEQAIKAMLSDYVETYSDALPPAGIVRVARVGFAKGRRHIHILGPAAIMGSTRSRVKAAASRANGKLGGRPKSKSGPPRVAASVLIQTVAKHARKRSR